MNAKLQPPQVLVAVGFLMLLLTSLQGWGMVGIIAVADGLESEADMRALQSMGCDVGQGPLLAEPMPKSELMDVFGERARTKHAWIG